MDPTWTPHGPVGGAPEMDYTGEAMPVDLAWTRGVARGQKYGLADDGVSDSGLLRNRVHAMLRRVHAVIKWGPCDY